MSSYFGAAIAAALSSALNGPTTGEYFPHRKNTPLSKQPHFETPKPLSKRAKRRAKGKSK